MEVMLNLVQVSSQIIVDRCVLSTFPLQVVVIPVRTNEPGDWLNKIQNKCTCHRVLPSISVACTLPMIACMERLRSCELSLSSLQESMSSVSDWEEVEGTAGDRSASDDDDDTAGGSNRLRVAWVGGRNLKPADMGIMPPGAHVRGRVCLGIEGQEKGGRDGEGMERGKGLASKGIIPHGEHSGCIVLA